MEGRLGYARGRGKRGVRIQPEVCVSVRMGLGRPTKKKGR